MKQTKTDRAYEPEMSPAQVAATPKPVLTPQTLAEENRAFAGTGGISQENQAQGFIPGYLDCESGEMVISRFANGEPAPIHLLEGLPQTWIRERAANGEVLQIKEGVIPGFILNGRFYTRQQAAKVLSQIH